MWSFYAERRGRSAVRRTAAAMAAVSARRVVGPRSTVAGRPPVPRRPSRPRGRRAPRAGRARAAGRRDGRGRPSGVWVDEHLGEACDGVDDRQPRQPRLHRSADRGRLDRTWPRRVAGPLHDGVARAHRDDLVDAELGELLHDPLGPLALGDGERDGDCRRGRVSVATSPSASSRPPAATRHARQWPLPSADGHDFTGAQP